MLDDLTRWLRRHFAGAARRLPFGGQRDPALRRRSEVESDRRLMPATLRWIDLLPAYARPRRFCERYPRIVNHLADIWADRKACKPYFESLLSDTRGGRAGFGTEVRKEILRLRVFYETSMTDAGAEQDWKRRMASTVTEPRHQAVQQPADPRG